MIATHIYVSVLCLILVECKPFSLEMTNSEREAVCDGYETSNFVLGIDVDTSVPIIDEISAARSVAKNRLEGGSDTSSTHHGAGRSAALRGVTMAEQRMSLDAKMALRVDRAIQLGKEDEWLQTSLFVLFGENHSFSDTTLLPTQEEARIAYKKLALTLHPDKLREVLPFIATHARDRIVDVFRLVQVLYDQLTRYLTTGLAVTPQEDVPVPGDVYVRLTKNAESGEMLFEVSCVQLPMDACSLDGEDAVCVVQLLVPGLEENGSDSEYVNLSAAGVDGRMRIFVSDREFPWLFCPDLLQKPFTLMPLTRMNRSSNMISLEREVTLHTTQYTFDTSEDDDTPEDVDDFLKKIREIRRNPYLQGAIDAQHHGTPKPSRKKSPSRRCFWTEQMSKKKTGQKIEKMSEEQTTEQAPEQMLSEQTPEQTPVQKKLPTRDSRSVKFSRQLWLESKILDLQKTLNALSTSSSAEVLPPWKRARRYPWSR
jgi:hypothetical protein